MEGAAVGMMQAVGAVAVLAAAIWFAGAGCRFLLRVMEGWADAAGDLKANYVGQPIPVGLGMAVTIPAVFIVGTAGAVGAVGPDAALGLVFPTLVMTLIGWLDDRWGDRSVRGVRAHLVAAWRGRWTTGGLKAGAGAMAALVSGFLFAP